MAIRVALLCALGAMLALPAAVRAQEPTVSAPDVRPAQGTAPTGPACGVASPQRRVEGSLTIDVRSDCSVTLRRRLSCRVTGTLGGEKATVTSTAAKITL